MNVPSGLCLMITTGLTFFLSFWTPFLTEQRTKSPIDPGPELSVFESSSNWETLGYLDTDSTYL